MWGTLKHALSAVIYYKIACTLWRVHLSNLSLPLMSAKLSKKQIPHQSQVLKDKVKRCWKKFSFRDISTTLWDHSVFRAVSPTLKLNSQGDKFLKKYLCYFSGQVNINEKSITSIQLLYVPFSFSEIDFCSRIFWNSRIEWHTRNAGNSWCPRATRTTRKRWS